jgi:hypothetical protein
MATRAKIRTAGLLAATLALPFCAAGTSQAADGQVINGQIQLGDVFSSQTLDVETAEEGLSGTAEAVGNIMSATGQNAALDVQSDQSVEARVEAAVSAVVAGSSGPYFTTATTATGNSATAGTCCAPTTGSSLQAIGPAGVVAADAYGEVRGTVQDVQADASAVGNTTGWNLINGGIEAWTGQTHQGLTTATNSGAFNQITGNAGFTAASVANNVTVDAENTPIDIGAGQDAQGTTQAIVDVSLTDSVDSQSVANGVGNNVDAQASGSTASMNVRQTASGPVTAYADVQAASWSGDANVLAYGVGDSVILSNAGPQANLWSDQTAAGDVSATASFTGGAGANVYAAATAMGNASSAYACAECGGVVSATNSQVASGRVRANANVAVTGRARRVDAESRAIGNNATYEVSSPD